MTCSYKMSPAIFGETLYFVTDDDLWSVSIRGGIAKRLSHSKGHPAHPMISPNGKYIAYTSNESGPREIYLMESNGGNQKRLTFLGDCRLIGWDGNEKIIFTSAMKSFHPQLHNGFVINIKTSEIIEINLGPIDYYEKSEHFELVGRNLQDSAKWKRYRGGTAGTLWVKGRNKKYKKILNHIKTSLFKPRIINKKIYFVSDHNGISNIFCCDSNGKNLKQITFENEFYIRSFDFYENKIVYSCGGEIYLTEVDGSKTIPIDIKTQSSFNQYQERFENADEYLESAAVSEKAKYITITSRGQLFKAIPWLGGVERLGDFKLRYKNSLFTKDNDIISIELNEDNEEQIVLFNIKNNKKTYLTNTHIGKIHTISISPTTKYIVFATNRKELWILNYETKKLQIIDKAPKDSNNDFQFQSISWSPCGNIIAYENSIQRDNKLGIYTYHISRSNKELLITPIISDFSPVFDDKGEYVYFIGIRELHPTFSELNNEINFPTATCVYAVSLKKSLETPLKYLYAFDDSDEDENDNDSSDSNQSNIKKTIIEYEKINQRIIKIPIEMGGHQHIEYINGRLFYVKKSVNKLNPNINSQNEDDGKEELWFYDLKTGKNKLFCSEPEYLNYSLDKKFLIYFDEDLRVVKTSERPTEGEATNKLDGWIDTDRFKVKINPKDEWVQMLKEVWILQREHFWTKDMSKINWTKIYEKYQALLPKVHTRKEFSDLIWEMQGELGTSHCYEQSGDYNKLPEFIPLAQLGAEFKFDNKKKELIITKIYKGDSWINGHDSPLNTTGVQLDEGDKIRKIEGQKVYNMNSVYQLLENKVDVTVNLEVKRKNSKRWETVAVKTLGSHYRVIYRNWVEKNKNYIDKKSNGKIGYIHIPDMWVKGYSEFIRQYISQHNKEALIIDVRYNGGGNVSSLILQKLTQKKFGICISRWGADTSYPAYSNSGNLVCLTNELAGSDGDIFCQAFKSLKLGKLIGKRTWGGVIGVWPRNDLVDKTVTTQPEYSFWFKDVGFKIENFGVIPDIEVDNTPDDFLEENDIQLDKALQEALKLVKRNKPLKPNLKDKPNLKFELKVRKRNK